MNVEAFHDSTTCTLTYVVFDPRSGDALVIDPVLDYDSAASTVTTVSADTVLAFVRREKLRVHYVLETHAHADHLTGSQYIKESLGTKVAIGRRITDVQATFRDTFDLGPSFATDGSQFDRLLDDGETFRAGTLSIRVLPTPGHTSACATYLIDDAAFVGDALFIEDYGTGRADFPHGDAGALYDSVHDRLYSLPKETRVFVGHDYRPGGRPLRWETTIGVSRDENVQLRASTTKEDFVRRRTERDKTLPMPRLLYPSVQVNIDGGRLPQPHANGRRYLRIPLTVATPVSAITSETAVAAPRYAAAARGVAPRA